MSAERPLVLVVDDDPTLRSLLTRILEREGLEVCAVPSGAEATKALEKHNSIKAIILDQSLPDTTGAAFAANLSDTLGAHRPPCILVTGTPDAIADEARAHFAKVLSKPFSLPELASTVRKIADRAP